jgi:hypothetical protein
MSSMTSIAKRWRSQCFSLTAERVERELERIAVVRGYPLKLKQTMVRSSSRWPWLNGPSSTA